jgi:diguanylate cyclase (GGDEF)-like protein
MSKDDERARTQIIKIGPPSPVGSSTGEAVLVVLYGPNLGKRFPLVMPGEYTIGRLAEVEIPVDAESVSRRHARIFSGPAGFFVEDLGSTNGSYVNDQRIERTMLKDGDIIRIGAAILKFLSGQNVESAYHEEIYRLTILDGLTGVHNKRFFLEFLDREISRASRHQTPLALVMFDVDHFKKVNDTHGHLAGDAVLKELCRRIKPRVRREDLLARYGGEEFACVLPDTTYEGAYSFAEKVRQLIEREPVAHDELRLPITISLGVSVTARGEQIDAPALIRRADEKLYEAKRGGRNRVCG